MNDQGKQIMKHLDRILSSGHNHWEIFSDFLDITHAMLTEIPRQAESVVKTRQWTEDTPETAEVLKRLKNRYPSPSYLEHFAAAFGALMASTADEAGQVQWEDTIGYVYMDWGCSNKHTGQFFTPFSVAKMMAELQGFEELIFQRLEEAYLKSPYGAMHVLISGEDRVKAFAREQGEAIVPMIAEHLQPITVNDPSCGSGVMFLAAASACPRWAINWGLVQFYGMDIDQDCVRMTEINCMLYGLNGYSLKYALAMSAQEIEQYAPEPWAGAYKYAKENPDEAADVTDTLRSWKQGVLV